MLYKKIDPWDIDRTWNWDNHQLERREIVFYSNDGEWWFTFSDFPQETQDDTYSDPSWNDEFKVSQATAKKWFKEANIPLPEELEGDDNADESKSSAEDSSSTKNSSEKHTNQEIVPDSPVNEIEDVFKRNLANRIALEKRNDEYRGWLWQDMMRKMGREPWLDDLDCNAHYLTLLHDFIGELCGVISSNSEELTFAFTKIEELSERLDRYEGKEEAGNARNERNAWIYSELFDLDKSISAIKFELRNIAEEKGWPDSIGTTQGLVVAAKRYAKGKGLPAIPKRRG